MALIITDITNILVWNPEDHDWQTVQVDEFYLETSQHHAVAVIGDTIVIFTVSEMVGGYEYVSACSADDAELAREKAKTLLQALEGSYPCDAPWC